MKLSENNKIILKHVTGAFLIKGLALLLSLFTTPAYIRYFNNDVVLGLWFTILSVLSWVLSFDLGLGNGLRNKLTQALAKNEEEKIKKYISCAYVGTSFLAILASIIFTIIALFLNWNKVFNIDSNTVENGIIRIAVVICFLGIMLQFVLKTINSILYSLQKSSVNNFLSLITSILLFLFVFLSRGKGDGTDLIVLAVVHSIAVLIPLCIATIVVFSRSLKTYKPSLAYFDYSSMKDIMSLGGLFFYLQIVYMIIISTNDYIITLLVSPESVVEYQIYYKFYSLGSIAFTLALTPVWSVVTKAINEKNVEWTKKLYKTIILVACLTTIMELLLNFFIQFVVNIFYKENAINVNNVYAISFSIFCSLMVFNAAFSSITNGMGKLKGQLVSFTIAALLKIPLSYFLVNLTNSWIGVVQSTSIVLLIYCIIEPIYIKKCFKALIKK